MPRRHFSTAGRRDGGRPVLAGRRAHAQPSGRVILKLCFRSVSKSNTSSKSSRRSSDVLRIWPMPIRLNTISPKSPVDCHSPAIEHTLGHVAVLFERILANGFAQLLAGQVPFSLARRVLTSGSSSRFRRMFGPHAQLAMGVVERLEDERVGVDLVAAVFLEQFGDRMRGVEHGESRLSSRLSVNAVRRATGEEPDTGGGLPVRFLVSPIFSCPGRHARRHASARSALRRRRSSRGGGLRFRSATVRPGSLAPARALGRVR